MSRTLRLRVVSLQYGAPGIVICQLVDDDAANYADFTGVGGGQAGFAQPGIGGIGSGGSGGSSLVGSTRLVLIDAVTLRDEDDGPGYYAAMSGLSTGWAGATLEKSIDGGASYNEILSNNHSAVIGSARTVLAATSRYEDWDDTNTVDIELMRPDIYSLSSDSDINVLNGANTGALICSNGEVEIFQWGAASVVSAGVYQLSHLLRARKGSDYALTDHGVGDVFVKLDSATVLRVTDTVAEVGISRKYKAVSAGQFIDQAAVILFTNTGASLKPLSPLLQESTRDGGSNLAVPFIRRTRIGADWRDLVDVPLGETTEDYQCDIFSDGTFVTLKRTITTTASGGGSVIDTSSHEIDYTSADQVTDFGSNQSAVYLKLYQMSEAVGRGFPATGTGV